MHVYTHTRTRYIPCETVGPVRHTSSTAVISKCVGDMAVAVVVDELIERISAWIRSAGLLASTNAVTIYLRR